MNCHNILLLLHYNISGAYASDSPTMYMHGTERQWPGESQTNCIIVRTLWYYPFFLLYVLPKRTWKTTCAIDLIYGEALLTKSVLHASCEPKAVYRETVNETGATSNVFSAKRIWWIHAEDCPYELGVYVPCSSSEFAAVRWIAPLKVTTDNCSQLVSPQRSSLLGTPAQKLPETNSTKSWKEKTTSMYCSNHCKKLEKIAVTAFQDKPPQTSQPR